ncbi:MAG: hypothetical protein H7239_06950 [Flavobacterium sp.]|nr:hypothetical protein [Flavobacterium sp.]
MTYQSLQTISQIIMATGLVVAALGGFGSYYFEKKQDLKKVTESKPIIDLCRRGISVKEIDNKTVHFDIPYCSGKNTNAHNVNLLPAVLIRINGKLKVAHPFSDDFPENITLSYETGKAMFFNLSPLKISELENLIICVKGSYTNESASKTFKVLDIYKFNSLEKTWVRTMGTEDKDIREYLNDKKLL